jgi:dihydroorotate dehydrogenase electron transfer subunit
VEQRQGLTGPAVPATRFDVARQNLTYSLIGREDLGAGYQVLRFGGEEPLAAKPGQFAMVRMLDWGKQPLLPRPMSILSGGDEPSMLVKVVGEGTARMAEAAVGEGFALNAPLGRPWQLPPPDHKPVLVAGGCGVAPLVFLAERLAADGYRADGPHPAVATFYGGRSDRDLPLAERLGEVSALQLVTEDGSKGLEGLVTEPLAVALEAERDGGHKLKLYACGPHKMMAAVASLAQDFGLPCEASLEAAMGCGIGVCLGCAVSRTQGGYLYTCVDGPCVDAATVAWDKRVF